MVNPTSLGPIKAVRSRDVLANILREQILTGSREAGSLLPPERDLVAETGLSRAAVRDALRVLEGEGLIETRQGRYGGSIVRTPANDSLAKPIELFVRGRQVALSDLIEARMAFEPAMAELAAIRRTQGELEVLASVTEELAQACDDIPRFLDYNVDWYLALADACHNDLLRAFMTSVSGLIRDATGVEGMTPEPTRKLIIRSHSRVLVAIEARDADAARRRMQRHVGGYFEHFNREPS